MNAPRPDLSERDAELLSAYLDEQLSAAERAELEARLRSDSELRAELIALRQTLRLVRELPTLRAPRDLRLRPEQVAPVPQLVVLPRAPRVWRVLGAAAAGLALVLVGGLFLLSQQNLAPTLPPQAVAALPSPTLALTQETSISGAAPALAQPQQITGTPAPTEAAEVQRSLPAAPPPMATQGEAARFAATPSPEPEMRNETATGAGTDAAGNTAAGTMAMESAPGAAMGGGAADEFDDPEMSPEIFTFALDEPDDEGDAGEIGLMMVPEVDVEEAEAADAMMLAAPAPAPQMPDLLATLWHLLQWILQVAQATPGDLP